MKPTTLWIDRFTEALMLLCGGVRPPPQAVMDWFSEEDSFDLQEFAINNTALPTAQGIAILDAARAVADGPVEGEGHELFLK
jgi:hypothetical protein